METQFKDRTDYSVMMVGYLDEGNPAELTEEYWLEKEGKYIYMIIYIYTYTDIHIYRYTDIYACVCSYTYSQCVKCC